MVDPGWGSGRLQLAQLCGQSRHFARASVLVDNALAHGAHQLRLSVRERRFRRPQIADGEGFLELADVGANARPARLVHLGTTSDFADRFLGAGIVRHGPFTHLMRPPEAGARKRERGYTPKALWGS